MQEGLLLNYLRLRPLVLGNTLSQMWDRLNLPMLLFKEGSVLCLAMSHFIIA